jgi:hypothetical protein
MVHSLLESVVSWEGSMLEEIPWFTSRLFSAPSLSTTNGIENIARRLDAWPRCHDTTRLLVVISKPGIIFVSLK